MSFSKINKGLNIESLIPLIHGKGKIIAGKNLSLRSFSILIELYADVQNNSFVAGNPAKLIRNIDGVN